MYINKYQASYGNKLVFIITRNMMTSTVLPAEVQIR